MGSIEDMIKTVIVGVDVCVSDAARASRVKQALEAALFWLTVEDEPEEEKRA